MKKYNKLTLFILLSLFSVALFPCFTYAGNLKIVAIKNMNVKVQMNTKYSLPQKLLATMSNHSVQNVSVTWAPKKAVTRKVGMFTYKGTVKGYTPKIILTLKVIALPKQNGTSPSKNQDTVTTAAQDTAAKDNDTNTGTTDIKTTTSPAAISESKPDESSSAKTQEETTVIKDSEILRAISYGFVPDYLKVGLEKTITYGEFSQLLTNLISLYDVNKVPAWKERMANAINSNEPMKRDAGALELYYSAEAIGLEHYEASYNLEGFVSSDQWWGGVKFNYPLLPGWDKLWKDPEDGKETDRKIIDAACSYVIRRVSSVDGGTLFDFDNTGLIDFGGNFTRSAAIKAALRLYESDWAVANKVDYTKWCNQKSLAYFNQAEMRKKEIMSSSTSIAYTGTAYYVSNHGNDGNDGKSSATAWATVSKVSNTNLNPGDAVFFERGGLWRGEYLLCREGVTYSAYGEGAKPIFTLSPENGADTGKWTLFYEGNNGLKIWKFYKSMYDCGNIYFDEGKSWAYKVAPHWRYGRWMNSDGTDFDLKKQMNKNHTFFSSVDSGLPKTNKIEYIWYPDVNTDGPLYFRCDEGNPGSVFKSIEFACRGKGNNSSFLELQKGCTVDNLCIRYVGTSGILPGNSDCTIQNCEAGWCGGAMLSDNGNKLFDPNKDIVNDSGGGIAVGGQNNKIINNYIHDTYQEGITLEGDYAGQQRNNTIIGNLIERANYGILIVHWSADENAEPFWNDVEVSQNIVVMSGFSWGNTQGTQGYAMGSGLDLPEYPNTNRNLRIHDNLFLGSYGWMFICTMTGKNLPDVSNNTFCVLTMNSFPFIDKNYYQVPAGQAEKLIKQKFGNDTNKVIILE